MKESVKRILEQVETVESNGSIWNALSTSCRFPLGFSLSPLPPSSPSSPSVSAFLFLFFFPSEKLEWKCSATVRWDSSDLATLLPTGPLRMSHISAPPTGWRNVIAWQRCDGGTPRFNWKFNDVGIKMRHRWRDDRPTSPGVSASICAIIDPATSSGMLETPQNPSSASSSIPRIPKNPQESPRICKNALKWRAVLISAEESLLEGHRSWFTHTTKRWIKSNQIKSNRMMPLPSSDPSWIARHRMRFHSIPFDSIESNFLGFHCQFWMDFMASIFTESSQKSNWHFLFGFVCYLHLVLRFWLKFLHWRSPDRQLETSPRCNPADPLPLRAGWNRPRPGTGQETSLQQSSFFRFADFATVWAEMALGTAPATRKRHRTKPEMNPANRFKLFDQCNQLIRPNEWIYQTNWINWIKYCDTEASFHQISIDFHRISIDFHRISIDFSPVWRRTVKMETGSKVRGWWNCWHIC